MNKLKMFISARLSHTRVGSYTFAATIMKIEVWMRSQICLILHLLFYTNFCKTNSRKKAYIAHSRNNSLLLLTRWFVFFLFSYRQHLAITAYKRPPNVRSTHLYFICLTTTQCMLAVICFL